MDEVKPAARLQTVEHREPCESRGSRTVLGAPGGEIPPGESSGADAASRGNAPASQRTHVGISEDEAVLPVSRRSEIMAAGACGQRPSTHLNL